MTKISKKTEEVLRFLEVAHERFLPSIENEDLRARIEEDFAEVRTNVLEVLGPTRELIWLIHRLTMATAHYCQATMVPIEKRGAVLSREDRVFRIRIRNLTQGEALYKD